MSNSIITTFGLTEKEAAFVRNLAGGMRKCKAAELAGYSFPGMEPARLLARRDVAAALRVELERRFNTELLPLADHAMAAVLRSKHSSDNARVSAGKAVWARAGLARPPAEPGDKAANGLNAKHISAIEKLIADDQAKLTSFDTDVIDNDPFGLSVA